MNDPEQQNILMQLHRRGLISTDAFLEKLDIDYDAEVEKLREEQAMVQALPPGSMCPVCGSVDVEIAWSPQIANFCRNCPAYWKDGKTFSGYNVPQAGIAHQDAIDESQLQAIQKGIQKAEDTEIFKALYAEQKAYSACPECKGTKVYVGFTKSTPCLRCNGSGLV